MKTMNELKNETISIRVADSVSEITKSDYIITTSYYDKDSTKPIQTFNDNVFKSKVISEVAKFVNANKLLGSTVTSVTIVPVMN